MQLALLKLHFSLNLYVHKFTTNIELLTFCKLTTFKYSRCRNIHMHFREVSICSLLQACGQEMRGSCKITTCPLWNIQIYWFLSRPFLQHLDLHVSTPLVMGSSRNSRTLIKESSLYFMDVSYEHKYASISLNLRSVTENTLLPY